MKKNILCTVVLMMMTSMTLAVNCPEQLGDSALTKVTFDSNFPTQVSCHYGGLVKYCDGISHFRPTTLNWDESSKQASCTVTTNADDCSWNQDGQCEWVTPPATVN